MHYLTPLYQLHSPACSTEDEY